MIVTPKDLLARPSFKGLTYNAMQKRMVRLKIALGKQPTDALTLEEIATHLNVKPEQI